MRSPATGRAVTGTLLGRDGDPEQIVFERWENQASLEAHLATPHVAAFNAAIAGFAERAGDGDADRGAGIGGAESGSWCSSRRVTSGRGGSRCPTSRRFVRANAPEHVGAEARD